MLIIEGADLVGKTTLAKALAKKLNSRSWPHVYQHLSRLPHEWAHHAVENYARLCSPYVVRDRFHMSELVYSDARREEPTLSPGTYRTVDQIVRSYCGFTIVVVATPDLIEERYRREVAGGRAEMYDVERVLLVNQHFTDIATQAGRWRDYSIAFDHVISCDRDHPFPDPDQILLSAYCRRLAAEYPYSTYNVDAGRRGA